MQTCQPAHQAKSLRLLPLAQEKKEDKQIGPGPFAASQAVAKDACICILLIIFKQILLSNHESSIEKRV